MADAEVRFLARSLDPVRCDRGLAVIPTDTPETLPDPDLIVVPGSENPVPVLDDQALVDWLRAAAPVDRIGSGGGCALRPRASCAGAAPAYVEVPRVMWASVR